MTNRPLLIIGIIAGVAALGWWRYPLQTDDLQVEPVNPGTVQEGMDETLGTARSTQSQTQPPKKATRQNLELPADQQNDLAGLRRASSDAAKKVVLAEQRLDALDGQISALEAQIADIERRGDNPVEHADEVEPYLRPVLAEFFDAQVQFDKAVAEKDKADAALASALN